MHKNRISGRIVLVFYNITRKILLPTGIGRFYPVKFVKEKVCEFISSRIKYRKVLGHKMYLDSKDTLGLSFAGAVERVATQYVMKEIRKGNVVLDIGANIGYYTLIFAKLVGEEGKVIAFEPDPNNFALLKKNIAINGYQNVVLVEKAISNKSGKGRLYLAEENLGDHRIYESNVILGRKSIEIETIKLDDYFKDYEGRIDFIKMDIQGAEPIALEGMRTLIEKHSPKILTEFWPGGLEQFGIEPEEYFNLLLRKGFKLYDINELEKTVELVSIDELLHMERLETNLLCIRD